MDSDSMTLSRFKQVMNFSLTAVGLTLFVFLGSKAIGQIDDSRYVEGIPKTYSASHALMTADLEVSDENLQTPTTLSEQDENAAEKASKDTKAPADIAISQTTKRSDNDRQNNPAHAPTVRPKPAEKKL